MNKKNIGLEKENKVREWLSGNIFELAEANPTNTYHEVVKTCKFFADLDDKENKYSPEQFEEQIKKIFDLFREEAELFYEIKIAYTSFYYGISHKPYNSAHIFIDAFNADMRPFIFENSKIQGTFWYIFAKKHNFDIIDSCYPRNKQLRCSLSPKYGQTETYTLKQYGLAHQALNSSERMEGTFFTFGTLKKILYCGDIFNNFDEQQALDIIDRKLEGFECKGSFLPKYFYCANIDKIHGCIFLERDYISNKPTVFSAYERYMIEQALNNAPNPVINDKGRKKFDCRNNWLIILCICKAALTANHANEFMARCGWNREQDFKENKQVFSGLNCYMSFKKIMTFLKSDEQPRIYNSEVVQYDPIEVKKIDINSMDYIKISGTRGYEPLREKYRKIYVVKSGCDTQKTRQLFSLGVKTLFINYRVSLTNDLVNKNHFDRNIKSYKDSDVVEQIKAGILPEYLSIQLESLSLIKDHIFYYDLVVFDEAPMLINQLRHAYDKSPCFHKIDRALTEIMRTKNLIFCSANINENVFSFIRSYVGQEKINYSINEYQSKKWFVTQLNTAYDFENKMMYLAMEGKKLCIAHNSRSKALNLYLMLNALNKKVLLITSQTDKNLEDVNKTWINFDVVIYTPTIESGVSFTEIHFDHVCGFFTNKSNNHLGCFQQLIRCRNPKENEIFIYARNSHVKKIGAEYVKLTEESLNGDEQSILLEATEWEKNNKKIDYEEPVYKAILVNELFNSYSRFKLCSHLRAELLVQGIKWNNIGYATTDEKLIKERRAILKQLRTDFFKTVITEHYKSSKKIDGLGLPELKKRFEAITAKNNYNVYMNDFLEKLTNSLIKMHIITPVKVNDTTQKMNSFDNVYNIKTEHKMAYILSKVNLEKKDMPLNPYDDKPFCLSGKEKYIYNFLAGYYNTGEKEIKIDFLGGQVLSESAFVKYSNKYFEDYKDILNELFFKTSGIIKDIIFDMPNRLKKINIILKDSNLKITRCDTNNTRPGYNQFKIVKKLDSDTKNPYFLQEDKKENKTTTITNALKLVQQKIDYLSDAPAELAYLLDDEMLYSLFLGKELSKIL